MSLFSADIQSLQGVGERRAKLFRKLGAPTVGALLRMYPRTYEDLSAPLPVRSAPQDRPCAIKATVTQRPAGTRIRGGMTLYKARATNGESDLELVFFNNPYVGNLLKENTDYIFYGTVSGNFIRRQMTAPEIFPAASCPPVNPVYRQTAGLTSRMIGSAVKNALKLLPETMRDPIPQELRLEQTLCQLRFALENIHFPADLESLALARKRLIFEELLILQLGLFRMKGRSRALSPFRLLNDYTQEFYALLPFRPTEAQRRAVAEAMKDMTGGYPMNRLIQGDVGSGKTAVAAALCHSAVKNGMQAALMAPTELLAQQHFASLERLLAPAGIHMALLTGSTPAAQKRKIREGLADGSIAFVVGTHALLSENVGFQRLGLVVTDEQHRFGVAQRAALAVKGDHPHMLVMSATPIPRTLALMIYGDLDVSVLDELPPGRKKILTYAVSSKKRARAFGFLKKHLDAGRQCYIICPMVDEGQNDMASVEEYAEKLKNEWLPGYRVGTLHGRMKPKDKEAAMADFKEGKTGVLVSTTVVEVGVDVPNAAVMMIENAERYGLSQLHQLRGRVGRGKDQSYCILVSDAQNDEAVTRLAAMCRTNDGFQIADEDLKLRGPGDFFGHRQHGLPELKIADFMTDMELLKQAQTAAKTILDEDPELSSPQNKGLRAEVRQLFENLVD